MADKAWAATLDPLLRLADLVVAVSPALERSLPAEELAAHCRDRGLVVETAASVAAGLDRARRLAAPDDLVLVCGSLFTVGEARAGREGRPPLPIRG
jgi:dihydrofolate synthase/folylpolyglutamate synthase